MEEQWILDHLPLVRHVVSRVCSQVGWRDDLDDLVQAGTLGLVKAARKYDPSREAEFKTYAYIRVRGAVIDELRGRSFLPPSMHKRIRQAEETCHQFISERGTPPTDEELAERLGVKLNDLYKVMEEARRQQFLSIHGSEDSGSGAAGASVGLSLPDRTPGPEDQAQRHEAMEKLTEAIGSLGERDRMVLLLYYERDLTMKEAAEVLGVTESRISQLHAAAVFKLATRMRMLK
jgi:RNA polymerase sigma factor for flagellar operon FliA